MIVYRCSGAPLFLIFSTSRTRSVVVVVVLPYGERSTTHTHPSNGGAPLRCSGVRSTRSTRVHEPRSPSAEGSSGTSGAGPAKWSFDRFGPSSVCIFPSL